MNYLALATPVPLKAPCEMLECSNMRRMLALPNVIIWRLALHMVALARRSLQVTFVADAHRRTCPRVQWARILVPGLMERTPLTLLLTAALLTP